MDVKTVIKVRWHIKGGPESNRTHVPRHRHAQKEDGVRTWGEDDCTSWNSSEEHNQQEIWIIGAERDLSHEQAHMNKSARLSHHLSP